MELNVQRESRKRRILFLKDDRRQIKKHQRVKLASKADAISNSTQERDRERGVLGADGSREAVPAWQANQSRDQLAVLAEPPDVVCQ